MLNFFRDDYVDVPVISVPDKCQSPSLKLLVEKVQQDVGKQRR